MATTKNTTSPMKLLVAVSIRAIACGACCGKILAKIITTPSTAHKPDRLIHHSFASPFILLSGRLTFALSHLVYRRTPVKRLAYAYAGAYSPHMGSETAPETELQDDLLARVRLLTVGHGQRKALAEHLKIQATLLSAYLAEPPTRRPNGEMTLRLQAWVKSAGK